MREKPRGSLNHFGQGVTNKELFEPEQDLGPEPARDVSANSEFAVAWMVTSVLLEKMWQPNLNLDLSAGGRVRTTKLVNM